MKRIALLLLIAALAGVFFYFDLQQWLTLEGLKTGLTQFEQWRSAQPIAVAAAFLLFYIAVAALSLPGAAVMTVAGGALFGLLWGTVLVSFASTIGATLAFLVARYLLHDTVQQRFGERLQSLNAGMKQDGAFYLFTLRLVPVFPFFLINLLMGLTSIRTITFYWVSQLGMLAGTIIYVNAGTQLAQLQNLSGILSPPLLLSLALLGVFPLLAKKILTVVKAKRIYANYQKPARFDRNLIVVGAGAGGLVTAYIAATVKAKVTLIEAHKMGGDCLNYGCVPSKALIRSAKLAQQMRHADNYGLEAAVPEFSFGKIMARIQTVIRAIEPHDSIERYTSLGVEVIAGYARLVDPWTVEIKLPNGELQRLTSRAIVLATGAQPFIPPLPGIDAVGYVTSDTLWDEFSTLDKSPERLVVLGGGPIGCELAQSFARLGSQVTQVEMAPRILLREDEEAAAFVHASLERDGVSVLTQHKALRCELVDGEKRLIVEYVSSDDKVQEKIIVFDAMICAVGRVARLDGYGLAELGIDVKKTIVTNDYLQTLYPNIFAAGDAVGPYQFTHAAAHQAWYAAVNALFGQFAKFKVDYRIIPRVTFTDPEVACVGLNEQEAIAQKIPYEVTRYGIDDLDRAIVDSAAQGVVKVLTVPGKDRILGVTIVGEHSGEILAEFVLAMKHGLGLKKILGTIHAYPTWAEANKYAAGEWSRTHAPQQILVWLEKYHNWRRGNARGAADKNITEANTASHNSNDNVNDSIR